MRDLYHGHTPVVLRPGSVDEVAAILKLANETKTAIVPQGGNTGLVGGQIPFNGEIVLSLTRLDKIREVDAVSNTMTVEAGVTLQRAREAAAEADRLYPQLLPSEGSCTIGGNLVDQCRRHRGDRARHRARACSGLEVVLADGRVLHNLNKLKKDNTGYDLQKHFHRRRRHARHHHRGGAAAGAAAARGGNRLRRRAVAAGRGRSARPRDASAPPAASPRSS